jgi:hypothetical protein
MDMLSISAALEKRNHSMTSKSRKDAERKLAKLTRRRSDAGTRRLSLCAPQSCAVEHGDGTYSNRPWTEKDVSDAIFGGAWFSPTGQHNFANSAARKLAMDHFFRLPRDQFGRIMP